MKALTYLFSIAVVGAVVSLGMGIYTGVRDSRAKAQAEAQAPALAIPTPALGH